MSKRRKNILITGGNFTNQGAYLMLCAAAEQIRSRWGAQPVIAMQTGSERAKRWVGLDSLLEFPKLRIRVWGGNPERLSGLRHRMPFVVGSEIDAVFDVSGFVFSDEWAHLDLRRRADDLIRWSDRGVPVVLLPQAFGPLEQVTEPVADLLDSCELVYARDPDSARFLKGAARSRSAYEKIAVATDFTTALAPEEPRGLSHLRGMVPIVPNWNIAKRAAARGGSKDDYMRNLQEIVRVLRAHDYEVYGLCHEGGGDADLLHTLAGTCGGMPVIEGLDGRQSKWLLGQAPFIVSGRFHALVSALSQGVPGLVHGWSHKYKWLSEEYDVSGLVMDPYENPNSVDTFLSRRLEEIQRIRESVSELAIMKKAETEQMWDDIEKRIEL
ncbi:polysaccharide pyruvyl transferase family protein [Rhodococcus sp. HM1]|uniref:polysaccharide pyruvyl transferase family protein n=1 Tax=Rhodococcus sp. HM1 TaxID=2937759 RepID=UPI00200B1687|nr:polysaccharide pyruvyl transferase family protein [Rhodococcus sp. HM1]MCK8671920.1 polysaccharide pyruvyl transferase family protein [Rhodococcus sp. HM1]